MTDAFALLNEPRRPWFDAEELKARFLPLSAGTHPDKTHGASADEKRAASSKYAELNAAFNTLKEPRDRLRHLYELEAGEKPKDIQRIPPGTMDLFVEVGQTCRDADAFLQKKSGHDSPMLKLQWMQDGFDWLDRLQSLQGRVNTMRDQLSAELREMNGIWDAAPPSGSPGRRAALPLERLEQIYRSMSYIARWTEQIQERLVQLSL
ncbi:MAG TPA: hypothetical protein PLX89_06635 [Verrucomicrobiota bacterium]|nr:hypothetical protein [Verrucomicrobiales bacterium]HRI12668.1 hypothetical protein [Verrucomicrobiota bacterium]